jgi:hypothetical protein
MGLAENKKILSILSIKELIGIVSKEPRSWTTRKTFSINYFILFFQVFNFNKILLLITSCSIFSTYKDSNVFVHFCGPFLNVSNLTKYERVIGKEWQGQGVTGVRQSPSSTLNTYNGHLTISVTPVKKGEAEVVLQFYTLLLIWDVASQVQVLLHLEW